MELNYKWHHLDVFTSSQGALINPLCKKKMRKHQIPWRIMVSHFEEVSLC